MNIGPSKRILLNRYIKLMLGNINNKINVIHSNGNSENINRAIWKIKTPVTRIDMAGNYLSKHIKPIV